MKPHGLPRRKVLRDSTIVVLRALETTDAKALLEFYQQMPEEDRIFLDDDVTDPQWIARFIQRIDFDKWHSIVAEADGRIFGHAWLIRTHYGWMSHVGQMRIGVSRDCRNKGLGSALIRETLCMAVDAGLEMMTLRVMENQTATLKMFEKLGFKRAAVLPGFVKDTYGRRRNLVILGNDISQIWRSMEFLVSDTAPTRDGV